MTDVGEGIPPYIRKRIDRGEFGVSGPHCPECDHDRSAVIDSRPTSTSRDPLKNKTTRRRRVCLGCEGRWTTYEVSEAALSLFESRMIDWVLRLELLLEGMPGRRRLIKNSAIRDYAEGLTSQEPKP